MRNPWTDEPVISSSASRERFRSAGSNVVWEYPWDAISWPEAFISRTRSGNSKAKAAVTKNVVRMPASFTIRRMRRVPSPAIANMSSRETSTPNSVGRSNSSMSNESRILLIGQPCAGRCCFLRNQCAGMIRRK